jgi:hypothetical protein
MTWFTRLYHATDTGWCVARTPDDQPIAMQDAFFWFACETIARELNVMRTEQMAKQYANH